MSMISERLEEIGYERLLGADNFDSKSLVDLSGTLGFDVPVEYQQFLLEFPNTGIFDADVLCHGKEAAPCAPNGLYPISLLYARSSRPSIDLLRFREMQSEIPDYLLVIGHDDGGNYFCIDLRKDSFGKIYFFFSEESVEKGLYLLANDFASFVNSLHRVD